MNPVSFKCAQLVWKIGGESEEGAGETTSLKGQFAWIKVKQVHFMGDLEFYW